MKAKDDGNVEDPYATLVVSAKSNVRYQLTTSSNFYEEKIKISDAKKGLNPSRTK